METKQMAFSGSWYPVGADECETSIKGFLKEKEGRLEGHYVGGVVPHAGWYFSGSIACRVIASLQPGDKADSIDSIVLFGAHMHRQSEPFILSRGAVETPFGDIEVDQALSCAVSREISIREQTVQNFPDENTLELQYPFIKYFFPKAKIVVCGIAPSSFAGIIGRTAAREAKKLSRMIRVIGSTDMTHYGPDFGFTPEGTGKKAVEWVKSHNDGNGVDALKQMDGPGIITQGLADKNMCCPGAAAAAVEACKELGAVRGVSLDYATSFEKSASSSFVGYAGVLYAKN